jgi:hypothetical protein
MKNGTSASESSWTKCLREADVPERLPFFPVFLDGKRIKRAFWRDMKHRFEGRDATLILAIIASFIAWNVTYLLRAIFG